ncbi:MAG: hypothetical protein GXY48_02690 [Methanomicrobiales archaeon]|nr:hypothetical protein [Methanomicrobiales archaeon]
MTGVSLAEDTGMNVSETVNTMDINSMDIINDTELQSTVLENLESNGVDTSVLRAAISVGATGKVRNILELYKDKLQANPDYVKPEESENQSAQDITKEETSPAETAPVGTEAKSPLSPFTILVGLMAGVCIIYMKK